MSEIYFSCFEKQVTLPTLTLSGNKPLDYGVMWNSWILGYIVCVG